MGPTSDPKGFQEKDLAQLLDLAHERLPGPMILVWDNSTQHMDAKLRRFIAGRT